LINVGVTRARERLVVVTDKRAIDILSRKDDDLYALIDYVQKNGTSRVSESAVSKLTIGFSNDSVFEDEFYKTMSHYCTVQGTPNQGKGALAPSVLADINWLLSYL
jgi:hypothetical protein